MDRKDFDLDCKDLDVGSSKSEVVVKKKGGFLGKLVSFLLGMIFGAIALVGGVIGGTYFAVSRIKINDAVNKVEGLTGIQIPLDDYLSEVYANQTVLELVKDLAKVARSVANGTGTLGDFNEISPAVGKFIAGEDGLVSVLAGYGLQLDETELMKKYLIKGNNANGEETDYLFGYVMSEVRNMPMDSLLKVAGMEGNALIDILVYGIEDEDYTRDEQGNIVMNEGKEILTLGGMGGADLTDRILKAPAGSFMNAMGFAGNDLLDTLIYGIEGEDYTLVGDKKVMNEGKEQLKLEGLLGSEFETRLDKLPVDALLEVKMDDSMMLAVAYGAEHRYTIDGDKVVMNPVEYTFDNGSVYDDNGDEVKAKVEKADVSEFTYVLTFDDGSKQFIKLESGKYIAYAYEENTDAYKPVLYPKNTVGALQDDMSSLVDAVTLADILGVEQKDGDVMSSIAFDKDGKARTIGDLRDNQAEIIDGITLADALGIDESETGMMGAIAFEKDADGNIIRARTLADFKDGKSTEIIDGITLADALGLKQEDGDMMAAIAFDKDGNARTIGDFKDKDTRDAIISGVELTSVIKKKPGEADAVVCYMLYGKEGVHFTIDTNGDPVYLQKRVAVYGTTVYNEYGEALEGATLNTSTMRYTYNGQEYQLIAAPELGTVETTDEHEATLYYIENEYYSAHTIGDMQDGDLLTNMNHHLTLGDMMDVSGNSILKTLGDVCIDDLPKAINNLTIEDVFSEHFSYRTIDGNETIETYKLNEDGQFVDENDNIVNDPTIQFINIHNQVTSDKDEALTGTWKYLLLDKETGEIHHDYTLVNLNETTSNLSDNMQAAPLYELKRDGIINDVDYNTLDKPLITTYPYTDTPIQIKGVNVTELNRFDTAPAGQEDVATLGDLTVIELMEYMSIVLDLL